MQRAPGRNLLALARRILSRAEIDRIIEPAIADLQHEWWASGRLSFSSQLLVRARAYLGALRVVGARLLAAGSRATLEPPPSPLITRVLCLSVIQLAVFTSVYTALDLGRVGEHWPFYLTDYVARFLPMVPLFWARCFERGPLGGPTLMPRAGDMAKLTIVVATVCLVWSGWAAPLLRQQYLVAYRVSEFPTAAVHQWTLDQLVARLDSGYGITAPVIAAELHKRMLDVALTILFSVSAWVDVRATSVWSRKVGTALALSGVVGRAALLGLGAVLFSRPPEWFILEWTSVLAGLAVTMIALRAVTRAERSRRPVLEAKVLALLQALQEARLAALLRK